MRVSRRGFLTGATAAAAAGSVVACVPAKPTTNAIAAPKNPSAPRLAGVPTVSPIIPPRVDFELVNFTDEPQTVKLYFEDQGHTILSLILQPRTQMSVADVEHPMNGKFSYEANHGMEIRRITRYSDGTAAFEKIKDGMLTGAYT